MVSDSTFAHRKIETPSGPCDREALPRVGYRQSTVITRCRLPDRERGLWRHGKSLFPQTRKRLAPPIGRRPPECRAHAAVAQVCEGLLIPESRGKIPRGPKAKADKAKGRPGYGESDSPSPAV